MLPAREGRAEVSYRSIDNIEVLRQRTEQGCHTSRTMRAPFDTSAGLRTRNCIYFVRFISNLLGTALVPCNAVSIERDIDRILQKETQFFGVEIL